MLTLCKKVIKCVNIWQIHVTIQAVVFQGVMLQNLALVIGPFNVQERSMGFNEKAPEVPCVFSDSSLQLTLKSLWLILCFSVREYKLLPVKAVRKCLTPHVPVSGRFLQNPFPFGWLDRWKPEAVR